MPVTYLLFGREAAIFVTTAILLLMVALEALRIGFSLDSPFWRKHLKARELKKPTGALFYVASSLLVMLLFEKHIAVPSIFVLALCDPASAIVGLKWGKRRFRGKSAEGTGAFFLCAFVVLVCFSAGIPVSLGAAAAATAAEFFSSPYVDDNFSIPLVTALALRVATW
jgi:dolichol kinase